MGQNNSRLGVTRTRHATPLAIGNLQLHKETRIWNAFENNLRFEIALLARLGVRVWMCVWRTAFLQPKLQADRKYGCPPRKQNGKYFD